MSSGGVRTLPVSQQVRMTDTKRLHSSDKPRAAAGPSGSGPGDETGGGS